ncbi:MAG: ABC transporter permease [Planctomycetales bacterium]|jgi:peptide/nickel transport system permease protein|nr:ABC transporter permease [Planctomycetales bacterium]
MTSYLFKRLLLMIPTLFGILVVSFLVIRLAPGDPASQKFGGVGQASGGINAERGTEAAEKRFRERFGFDKPLYIQFGMFLRRLATADMIFFQTEQKIWRELWEALRITILLNLIVFVLIYVAAVPLGIISAAYPHSWTDRVTTLGLFIMYSLPSFWVAEMLRMQFGNWLPIMGLKSQNFDQMNSSQQILDYLRHIALPVLCMTYGGLAYVSRQMRAGMLEVIRQDYIRTAEAKGAGKARVILVHALRNSLFPIITLFASLLPFLVGGSVIIEVVFNIHGMGLLSYEGVLRREYDLVMTTLMLSAVLTLIGILVSDILYVVVNPRVSFEDGSR